MGLAKDKQVELRTAAKNVDASASVATQARIMLWITTRFAKMVQPRENSAAKAVAGKPESFETHARRDYL